MEITWLGTASILIEAAGERILFDPFLQLKGGENQNSLEDFARAKDICITHGHLDHLMAAPFFLEPEFKTEATVYCGSVAAKTLEEQVTDTSNVVEVGPGDRFRIGEVEILVHQGRHAVPGRKLIWRTLLRGRLFRYLPNALFLARAHRVFPEKGQTLLYELRAEGKTVLVMGSLGLMPGAAYPRHADLLILPFQGCEQLEREALCVVEALQPARVLLDHFDDAFPPISSHINTCAFKKLMDEKYPEIPVAKPVFGKAVRL